MEMPIGAGFRYYSYGPPYDPGVGYWQEVGQAMAAKFPGTKPQGIWIVGVISEKSAFLGFLTEVDIPYIYDLPVDANEVTLDLFVDAGLQVWLQVEPGMAPAEDLVLAILVQYRHHPSVIGVGVDVEWCHSYEAPEGKAITEEKAANWVPAVRSHGGQYLCS